MHHNGFVLFPNVTNLLIDFRDAIYNHLISRVRDNLHIVLCMSPVGEAFRTRCRMFPSLVNCCTIDWFSEWPRYETLCMFPPGFKSLMAQSCHVCKGSTDTIHTVESEPWMSVFVFYRPINDLFLLETFLSILRKWPLSRASPSSQRI